MKKLLITFFLLFCLFLFRSNIAYAESKDNRGCKNLTISWTKKAAGLVDDPRWNQVDPKADYISWSVTVNEPNTNKEFVAFTDDGRDKPPVLDYRENNLKQDINHVVKGQINAAWFSKAFEERPHKITLEVSGDPTQSVYCQFNPAYIVITPPATTSASCNLLITSNGDSTGKRFTTDSEIYVQGSVSTEGFGPLKQWLTFSLNNSMRVTGPDDNIYFVGGPCSDLVGCPTRQVNYVGNKEPNPPPTGDATFNIISDLYKQNQEGEYTVSIEERASLNEQNSIAVGAGQDEYGRWLWAPIECSARFRIANDGTGGFITPSPTPVIPTPTIPAFCGFPPCDSSLGDKVERCNQCPGRPGFKPKPTPKLAIPNLRPLCDQLPTEFSGKCWDCQKTGGIWSAIGCLPTDFSALIKEKVFPVGLGIAGGVAFLYFLYGAFMILTSSGNAETIEEAKQIITSALAGLLLIIFSILILQVIGVQILQLPGFK